MVFNRPTAWSLRLLLAIALVSTGRFGLAAGQGIGTLGDSCFELSEAVEVDQVDNGVRLQLDKVESLVADRQWDEAIEILRQLAESPDGKLVSAGPRRYIGLQEWCQRELLGLPSEGLKLYRSRVDPTAGQWYERGIAARDRKLLQDVADRALASSYGLRALVALGEIALESGDYAAARAYWEQVVVSDDWANRRSSSSDPQHVAAARARLVLVSILAGERDRARGELVELQRLYPEATGRLFGHQGRYVELLETLLAESKQWPPLAGDLDWLTFAGNSTRNKIASALPHLGKVAWRVSFSSLGLRAGQGGAIVERPAFHPVLVGDLVLVNDAERIVALRRQTGRPAWGESAVIYRVDAVGEPSARSARTLGTPQYTMTVHDHRLYARMGVGGAADEDTGQARRSHLVCLDLAAEGRLIWKIAAGDDWTWESSPLADERNVYVALRRGGVRPQAAVACFDAGSGRLRWRRFVSAAESPGFGLLPGSKNNLLTLSGGTLYCNTNLGAVAALRAEDGRMLWLSLYPRALRGDVNKLASHWQRQLNPCIVRGATVFVAPSDSPGICAFDSASGRMLWQTGKETENVFQLSGATDDWLIAAGSRLYWIGLAGEDRGKLRPVPPDGSTQACCGRGVLAGDCVMWSTRDTLYATDLRTAHQQKVLDLGAMGITGGNLLATKGGLLVTGDNELTMIESSGQTP